MRELTRSISQSFILSLRTVGSQSFRLGSSLYIGSNSILFMSAPILFYLCQLQTYSIYVSSNPVLFMSALILFYLCQLQSCSLYVRSNPVLFMSAPILFSLFQIQSCSFYVSSVPVLSFSSNPVLSMSAPILFSLCQLQSGSLYVSSNPVLVMSVPILSTLLSPQPCSHVSSLTCFYVSPDLFFDNSLLFLLSAPFN